MRVAVLGAGVIGVSTAWHLARAGADVVVLERQSGPALETSFANAGQVSPGYSTPWAAPGIPLKALKWLLIIGVVALIAAIVLGVMKGRRALR